MHSILISEVCNAPLSHVTLTDRVYATLRNLSTHPGSACHRGASLADTQVAEMIRVDERVAVNFMLVARHSFV